jgi:hypothetical protein
MEQLFVERVNDIRANPAAFGLPGRAAQPFAFAPRITAIARNYSNNVSVTKARLRGNGVHFNEPNSIVEGMAAQGVPLTGAADVESFVRALAQPAAGSAGLTSAALLSHWSPALRRLNPHRLIGLALHEALADVRYVTLAPADGKPILTGSVFRDTNHNGKYDLGEGLSGVTIRVAGQKAVGAFASGGYTLPLARAGTVRVTASGGGLSAPLTQTVRVPAGKNTRLNFVVP